MMTVPELDAMPAREAAPLFASCCGSGAWVERMLARRPFGSVDALLAAADEVWGALAPDEWLEAFAHHPRIGERQAAAAQGATARGWSAEEQRGATAAADDVKAALAEGNREYERRFGHIYLVCATGKSAPEMLALLRERLTNDPATELRVAAAEQAKITRLRLRKLLDDATEAAR
jgi:2-oxo-4-hydroxy-4-carboxy-5-ureidoimidazoline decarboxylase